MARFSIYISKCIKRAPARFRRFRNLSACAVSACCGVRSGRHSARAGAHQRAKTGPGDAGVPSAALAESRARRPADARAAGGRPCPFFSHRFALASLTLAAPHGGARCERARDKERAEFGPRGALDPAAALANSLALRCAKGPRAVSQYSLNSPFLIASRRLRSALLAAAPRVHARAAARETRTPRAPARVWHAPRVARALARRRGRGGGASILTPMF